MIEFVATIPEDDPRYAEWVRVMGKGEVPVTSLCPMMTSIGGEQHVLAYKVDIAGWRDTWPSPPSLCCWLR